MSIDYGDKRIGIAVTDPLGMFATPFSTIENKSDSHVMSEIQAIVSSLQVQKIVLGLPLNKDAEDTPKTLQVRAFFQKLSLSVGIPICLWNELYSTCEANDILKSRGIGWKDSKKIIDQIAAAVILQSYIDSTPDNR
jgi:putative Holliday junction resolvase